MDMAKGKPVFTTPQEEFWAGGFGDEYIERNCDPSLYAARLVFWARVSERMPELRNNSKQKSCLELGANIGLNLKAIADIVPGIALSGVEINKKAAEALRGGGIEVFNDSILNFNSTRKWDLVFTCGVLIHINPDSLTHVYDRMYASSSRYIMICEYYNPSPVEIEYRNHAERLFKRDFAGEMMDRHPDLRLVDYGFVWRRDNSAMDDLTWFLMEK